MNLKHDIEYHLILLFRTKLLNNMPTFLFFCILNSCLAVRGYKNKKGFFLIKILIYIIYLEKWAHVFISLIYK